MVSISEIVSTWPEIDPSRRYPGEEEDERVWRISPGVTWCKKGSRVIVGERCFAGKGLWIDDGFVVGDDFRVGEHFMTTGCFNVGDGFQAGDMFSAGAGFLAGNNFQAGDRFVSSGGLWVGNNFKVGDDFSAGCGFQSEHNARGIAHLGFANRRAVCMSELDGVAYISTGHHWLTLAEALAHFERDEDRSAALYLLESAKALANLHKLRWER